MEHKYRMVTVPPGGFCTHSARPTSFTWTYENPEGFNEQFLAMIRWCEENLGQRRSLLTTGSRKLGTDWWMSDANNNKFFFGNEKSAFLFKLRWC